MQPPARNVSAVEVKAELQRKESSPTPAIIANTIKVDVDGYGERPDFVDAFHISKRADSEEDIR